MAHLIMHLRDLYKRTISPLIGPRCRFHPSCSDYCAQAVTRFGWLRGGWLTVTRLCRCHPLADFGVDPIPDAFSWRKHALGTRPLPTPQEPSEAADAVGTAAESAKLNDPLKPT